MYGAPRAGYGPAYPGQMPPPGPAYPGQPYPGQPYPGQPYPGQMPPPGMPPAFAPGFQPTAPQFPGMAPPPAAGGMSAFARNYTADETWHCNPADVPKEMGLINNRKNDTYPQGRDNCMQFLRDCQMRGIPFKVKAVKTKPYWTWYYEFENAADAGRFAPAPAPMPAPMPMPAPAPAYRDMSEFTRTYYADQEWNCNPGDAQKEMGLIQSRSNDIYPQGRDNCMQFLRDCQMRGMPFKVKAVKTKPYWTWYFEVSNTAAPAPAPVYPGGGMVRDMSEFTRTHYADQEWNCNPGDVPKELGLIDNRKNDIYPQGRDNCKQFLHDCQMRGMRFKVKAAKTKPYWTWYYEVSY